MMIYFEESYQKNIEHQKSHKRTAEEAKIDVQEIKPSETKIEVRPEI
jgi:hypothetical protein